MEDLHALINRLKNSALEEKKKQPLMDLLPFMTDAEKAEVLQLIEKSNELRQLKRQGYAHMKAFKQAYRQRVEQKKREVLAYGRNKLQEAEAREAEALIENLL